MIGGMPLEDYRAKRRFERTPEPQPGEVGDGAGRFVVQRHRATALHYDFRLEIGGVLVSWAIPKGPTLDPGERRLAMRTEDHPIEYLPFEGVIPEGEYGGGDVIVWDWGTFEPEETDDPAAAIAAGELKFRLRGARLQGRFTIVRTDRRDAYGRSEERERWLLIHKRDEAAVEGWDAEDLAESVKTGRTNDQVRDGMAPRFALDPPKLHPEADLAGAQQEPMPDFVPPMLATAVEDAFDDANWLFEVKWDGYRVQAVVRDGRTRLWTRKRVDAAGYFPDLADERDWIDARQAIVDGEVVALDAQGRPSFSLLQDRTGLRGLQGSARRRDAEAPRPSAEERRAIPLAYMVFDLLYLDGRSLLAAPLEERKRVLHRVLRPHHVVRYASHVIGDGAAFTDAARQQDLEGVVAKRRTSAYQPGRRSRDWLKIKLRREQELVVVGWLPGQGTHKDLGSLIVAVHHEGELRHAGQVGSGIDRRRRRELLDALEPLRVDSPPVANPPRLPAARWVEPRIVISAQFTEWTSDNLLRQPVFTGIVIDREPAQVVQEVAIPASRVIGRGSAPRPRSVAKERQPAAARAASPDATEALGELGSMGKQGHWQVAGREVHLTNLDKVLFPATDETRAIPKRDLIAYYTRIGSTLLPHLAGHAVNLHRYPDGIGQGHGFWQKDVPGHAPEWIARWDYNGHEGPKTYVVVDQLATLAWLAQEAAVEIHPWTSPTNAPHQPSYALIDIDPGAHTTWEEVLVLARLYRTALRHLGIIAFPKVTGQRGIQAWIPVRRGYSFEETREWVDQLSRAIGATVPELVSWEWTKRDRKGRARLDYTQNAVNKTLVAPYSVRPAPGAPVSAPIRWEELDDPALRPNRWTIDTVFARLDDVGDLFASALELEQELPPL
jgi:bifunctional non-homologous end joining protein LigD